MPCEPSLLTNITADKGAFTVSTNLDPENIDGRIWVDLDRNIHANGTRVGGSSGDKCRRRNCAEIEQSHVGRILRMPESASALLAREAGNSGCRWLGERSERDRAHRLNDKWYDNGLAGPDRQGSGVWISRQCDTAMVMNEGMAGRGALLLLLVLIFAFGMIMRVEDFDAMLTQQTLGMSSLGRDKAAKQDDKHQQHRDEAAPHGTSATSPC
ncbi:hypothetical protein Saro_2149 [Novosphingobium aromaticivorans DSM 12444]|uniref:Uncharacterized protein n=1 Tax=Novosphingobium aromaticivorans (strain ATCC 700278 / DSM 12444 / CCUG 56034 / CIP 105152 / NBRC 16084 / F199) TaxID=279238 RepID=Q2G6D5_NOVAD|nr:hypothetical protein Saro_2149 [Novosphingobium aromaticivorans DSM 12444]